jgi:tRNA A-37 threonylcarbamoyl transferase component Bud32
VALTVQCPNPECGKAGSVPEERVGRSVRCPHCRTKFKVPPPSGPSTAASAQTKLSDARATVAPASPSAGTLPAAEGKEGQSAELPTQIGRFHIRARLGAGAFGTVYRAHDPVLDREVALKVPQAGTLDSPQRIERFLREARAAARLTHPNIVSVYETAADNGRYYIASAFIEGQSLAALVDAGPLDFRKAARIVRDLAEALAYAHERGIVHRDVKPANVLLDGKEQPHLMDFGLAHFQEAAEKLTHDGAILGTPAYMAPEQAAGQSGPPQPATDQYSLGVVLYELLCGRTPFSGPPQIVLFNILHTEPPAPRTLRPEVPAALEAICLRAMAKRPADRYPGCRQLADALKVWLRQGTAPVRTRPVVEPDDEPPSNPWLPLAVIGGACVILVLVVVGILMMVRGGGTPEPRSGAPEKADGAAQEKKPADRQARADRSDKGTVPADGKKAGADGASAKENGKSDAPKADAGKQDSGKQDGGKPDGPREGKKETDPPPGNTEVPIGPPSDRVVKVGLFEVPRPAPKTTSPVLLQLNPDKGEWTRLETLKPGTLPEVVTGRPLVSLPGYRSIIRIDSGVRLTLAGTVPEFFPGMPLLFESLVELHQHDVLDQDLTLRRGRILLANTRADRPVRVRVRFLNTTSPDSREVWDITLEEQESAVLIDGFGFFPPDARFYEDPRSPNRTGPVTQVGLTVLSGTVHLRRDSVSHALKAPPGPARMVWNSERGPAGPVPLPSLEDWTGPNPPLPKGAPKEAEALRTDLQQAARKLSVDLLGRAPEVGLRKALDSADASGRKLAVRALGALGMVPRLVDALGDKDRADVRQDAMETLGRWIASERDNEYKLYEVLKERYTAVEAEKIITRLHGPPDKGRFVPETYEVLIEELASPRVAIRELAFWRLYQLDSRARTMQWQAGAPPEQVQARWRKLIPRGTIPPEYQKILDAGK